MASDLDAAYAEARATASAGLKATLSELLEEVVITREQVSEIVRATAVGLGHRVDQVEIVADDDGVLGVYIYETSEPDCRYSVFTLPQAICRKVA